MRIVLQPVLVLFALSLSGCQIDIRLGDSRKPKPADTIVVVPADKATIAEIDAVMKLDFDNSRTAALKAIAKRQHLSDRAQIHLVNRTMKGIAFDNLKLEILQTLVANPHFCEGAKEALLTRLDELTFENFKTEMLRSINKLETSRKP